MFRKSVYALAVLFVITGFFVAGCGGGGGGGDEAGSDLKVLSVVPGGGNIQPATPIDITFNSSMDTSTLTLAGDMEPECDGGAWSSSSLTDDTLTISPDPAQTGLWTEGVGRIITVNVNDVDNRSLSTLTLIYTVDGAAPQVVEYTDNASPIMENTQIVIKFSESMDPGSLVLGGLMAADDHAAMWSSTLISDDTVTISPTIFWTQGIQQDLMVDAADLAGNSLSTLDVTYEIVMAPLLASASPPNGSVLGGTSDIVIVFSETMDTSSLVLAGTLTSDSFSTVWSITSYTDDTLTINPSSTWTGGFGLTLSVDADSMVGKKLSTLNLTYDVGMVHVSISSGMDSNTGSRALPMKTIQAGVDIAYLQSVYTVLVENGSYSEAVALAEGVNIEGGYDASWAISPSGITRIAGGLSAVESKYISVEARDVSLTTTLANLTINGPTPPSGSGESSWAVHIVDSTGVILDHVEIAGGAGGTGAAGMAGSNAAQTKAPSGAVGGNPGTVPLGSCSTAYGAGGTAGVTGDSRSGGAGGDGGKADTSCGSDYIATAGISGSDAALFGAGYGTGGNGGSVPGGIGQAGVAGKNGDPGTPGDGGLAGDGVFDTSTLSWDPGGIATDGLSDGTAGTGGGGGGGAAGANNLAGGTYGGGGGGGGAGGLDVGTGGIGAAGGGASMALFAANSSVTLNSVTITIGTGGRGGRGGAGGRGQPGGDGGAGGDTGGGTSGREIAGGDGASGGRAGQGGGGGGGAGGDAFGTFTYNANIVENDVTFQSGTAGPGGNGGAPNGNAGQDGSVIESFDQP